MRVIDVEHLGRPHVIGCWEVDGALVDPGPESSLETLLAALDGEQPGAVVLTHIHLDHAAATGAIVRRWPETPVYVHERGAPHLIDPSRLLASAERLYGDAMERLWGEIVPVPEENVRALAGGETVLGMRVAYTPGHASHHVCYLHEETGTAFVGDVAAVLIPATNLVVPPTPPPDIDVETWLESIDLVEGWAPERLARDPLRRDRLAGRAPGRRPRAAGRGGAAGPRARRGRLRGAAPGAGGEPGLDRGGGGGADPVRAPPVPVARARPLLAQARGARGGARGRERRAQARCSRIRSTASSMRSSGVVSEILKKPSPLGPYIEPGETITAASSSTSSANEVEVWPSGTGAQT